MLARSMGLLPGSLRPMSISLTAFWERETLFTVNKKPGGFEPQITRVQQEESLTVNEAGREEDRAKRTYDVPGTVLTAFMDWLI